MGTAWTQAETKTKTKKKTKKPRTAKFLAFLIFIGCGGRI
jgi:hypothetical protein